MPKLPSHLCLTQLPPPFSLALLSSQEPKPQLFSDQNVFPNKPSGAFSHRTGVSLYVLLAIALLLISVKMEVSEVCSFGGCNKTKLCKRHAVLS